MYDPAEPAAVQTLGLQAGGPGIQGHNLAGVQRIFLLIQEVEIGMHHLQVPVVFHLSVEGHPIPHPEAFLDPLDAAKPDARQGAAVVGNGDLKVFSPAGALDALPYHPGQDGGLFPDLQVEYEYDVAAVEIAAGKVVEEVFNRPDSHLCQGFGANGAYALDVLDGIVRAKRRFGEVVHHA